MSFKLTLLTLVVITVQTPTALNPYTLFASPVLCTDKLHGYHFWLMTKRLGPVSFQYRITIWENREINLYKRNDLSHLPCIRRFSDIMVSCRSSMDVAHRPSSAVYNVVSVITETVLAVWWILFWFVIRVGSGSAPSRLTFQCYKSTSSYWPRAYLVPCGLLNTIKVFMLIRQTRRVVVIWMVLPMGHISIDLHVR